MGRTLNTLVTAMGFALAIAGGGALSAQQTAHDHQAAQAKQPDAPPGPGGRGMMGRGQMMMDSGEELKTLLGSMTAARGQAKIEAMEALLTALVEREFAHRAHMTMMMEHMAAMTSGQHAAGAAPKE